MHEGHFGFVRLLVAVSIAAAAWTVQVFAQGECERSGRPSSEPAGVTSPGTWVSIPGHTWAPSLAGDTAWSGIRAAAAHPPARYQGSAVYDPVRRRPLLFGGKVNLGRSPNDPWAFELGTDSSWRLLEPRGPGVMGDPLAQPPIHDSLHDRMVVTRGRVTSALVWGDPPLPVPADLDPDVVNPASRGRWVTGFVEISTDRLAGAIAGGC